MTQPIIIASCRNHIGDENSVANVHDVIIELQEIVVFYSKNARNLKFAHINVNSERHELTPFAEI